MRAIWDRLRTGLTLAALAAAVWALPLQALWLPLPLWLRAAVVLVVAVAQAFLLGVYMHDGDCDTPLPADDDCDGGGEEEWFETVPLRTGEQS